MGPTLEQVLSDESIERKYVSPISIRAREILSSAPWVAEARLALEPGGSYRITGVANGRSFEFTEEHRGYKVEACKNAVNGARWKWRAAVVSGILPWWIWPLVSGDWILCLQLLTKRAHARRLGPSAPNGPRHTCYVKRGFDHMVDQLSEGDTTELILLMNEMDRCHSQGTILVGTDACSMWIMSHEESALISNMDSWITRLVGFGGDWL